MICDSWRCVGSWFGGGGGAAWVQALLTMIIIGWSIYDSHKTSRDNRTAELDRIAVEKIKEAEKIKLALYERIMKINFYVGQIAQAAFAGRTIAFDSRVADGHIVSALQPYRFLLDKAVDGLVTSASWELPDETVRQFINRMLIKGAQLQTIFEMTDTPRQRESTARAMGRAFAVANKYQQGIESFAEAFMNGEIQEIDLSELDPSHAHAAP